MKKMIVSILALIFSSSTFAENNTYVEIIGVGKCFTFIQYDNVFLKKRTVESKGFRKSMSESGIIKLSNPGEYSFEHFEIAECQFPESNKINIRLNGGELTEVNFPRNKRLYLSIGVKMQDEYKIVEIYN